MNRTAALPPGLAELKDSTLNEPGAVPMIVMTRSQDHVEAINSTLRNAGHPVHCTWIPDVRDLGVMVDRLEIRDTIPGLPMGGEAR